MGCGYDVDMSRAVRPSRRKSRSLNKRLTVRSNIGMQRGGRGSGITVDPARVHEARVEAGLSLGQLAGDDVSRTFIHFVEQGKSRPSKAVLSLIARRTGKPVSYFIQQPSNEQQRATDLVAEMTAVATRIRRFVVLNRLTKA